MSDAFILGINYWPRQTAMAWWKEFDAGVVADDFDVIAWAGIDRVRMFLVWEDFQPEPDQVDPQAVDHLVTVADLAAERGLGLVPTFFTGHMSGPNWVPEWLRGGEVLPGSVKILITKGQRVVGGYRSQFSDPVARSAAKLQAATVAQRLSGHQGVHMWNLGNEPDLVSWSASADAGVEWVSMLRETIHQHDDRPVTVGLHHASLLEDNGLQVHRLAPVTDVTVMHAFPAYSPYVEEPLDPDWAPFLVALTASLAGCPVLLEETGAPTVAPGGTAGWRDWEFNGRPHHRYLATEEDLAAYVEAVLPRLVEVGARGAFLWCFADYEEAIWDRPPCDEYVHERSFGLVRGDGSLKPHAEVVRAFAATRSQTMPTWRTLAGVDGEEYYRDPAPALRRHWREYKGIADG